MCRGSAPNETSDALGLSKVRENGDRRFLNEIMDAEKKLRRVSMEDGVIGIWAGKGSGEGKEQAGQLYVPMLTEKQGQSRLAESGQGNDDCRKRLSQVQQPS